MERGKVVKGDRLSGPVVQASCQIRRSVVMLYGLSGFTESPLDVTDRVLNIRLAREVLRGLCDLQCFRALGEGLGQTSANAMRLAHVPPDQCFSMAISNGLAQSERAR